jgi:hypothetical protein
MHRRVILAAAFLAALLVQFACVGKALAIPAFSRQHKTECTTCHTIYPELNEYGEAFRKNGYVWIGKDSAPAEKPAASQVRGGGDDPEQLERLRSQAAVAKDDAGKEAEPKGKLSEGLRLAAIPELLPVSFTASFDLAYDAHPQNGDKFDFSTRSLVLDAGGAFRDKAGFFITYTAYSQNNFNFNSGDTPTNNTPNINELFLVWHHAFNTPVNVKVGRFQPQLTLWKKSNKLTTADFAPAAYKVGSSPFNIEGTVDGLEVNSLIGNRVFIAGGVVDRDGQNAKDGYGHISFKLGGADFVGHEPAMDLDSESIWDFLSLTVAAYGYAGKNGTITDAVDTSFFDQQIRVVDVFNHFYRAGGDIDLSYRQLRLRLSGVYGRDSNPTFVITPTSDVRSLVLASEAEYMFDTNLIGVFRYEYQDDGSGITRRYIPAIAYAPLQNLKLTLEYKYEGVTPFASSQGIINRLALLGAKFSF